jgi:thioredoxin-related protein
MKRRQTIVVIVAAICISLFSSNCTAGDAKQDLEWKKFELALAEAGKTNKKVLVDVYTDWCGWCKKMDASTYADKGIASYLNRNYVVVKLNAESASKLMYRGREYTEREFASEFGVRGYPSTIFLTAKGEPITIYPGFADPVKFQKVLSFIGEDHYEKMKFEEYVRGKR